MDNTPTTTATAVPAVDNIAKPIAPVAAQPPLIFHLSKEEADALVQLVDIAVRERGLAVAEPAVLLYVKLKAQAAEQLSPPVTAAC